jgi:glycosyltransferase involved in cell wall biosynthesis
VEKQIRVALVHDYLTQRGGAERVALTLTKAFERAPLYVTLYNQSATYGEFADIDVRVSWLNKIKFLRRNHRLALPLLPAAVSSLKIDADLVVVSSSAFGHGITTDAPILVYCHTPPRFVYLSDEYLGTGAIGRLINSALTVFKPAFRRFDQKAAKRATAYLSNSSVVRERIGEVYGIEAPVLFPPHSIDQSGQRDAIPEVLAKFGDAPFCLVVSRLLPYKNVDKVVEAFRSLPNQRLVIVGSGPLAAQLQSALPDNAVMVSGISDSQMRWVYANAEFLMAPSYEDFGLTVIEAAAWGVPAVALRAGGYLDTVVENQTGIFFDTPDANKIAAAIERAYASKWDRAAVREHADKFSEANFIEQIRDIALGLVKNR